MFYIEYTGLVIKTSMILSMKGNNLNGMYVHDVFDKKESDFINSTILYVLRFQVKKEFRHEVNGQLFTCRFEPESQSVVRVLTMRIEFGRKKMFGDHIMVLYK